MSERLKIIELDETTPDALYCHYDGQIQPQEVCVILDLEDGEYSMEYSPRVGGGVTAREWHGVVRSYAIPFTPTTKSGNEILRETAEAAQRVLDTAEVRFDGSDLIGSCDDSPLALELDHLERTTEQLQYEVVSVIEAHDWFENVDDDLESIGAELDADTTNDHLDTLETRFQKEARDQAERGQYLVLRDVYRFLEERREELRDERRDELEELAERRDEIIGEIDTEIRRQGTHGGWGDSDHQIARRVGMSHTHVGRIRRGEQRPADGS